MPRTYALDATPVLGRRTGIGRYVEELVGAMAPLLRPDERLVLLAVTGRRNPLFGISHAPLRRAAELPGVSVRRMWAPWSTLEASWHHFGGPAVDRVTGPVDVFHATNYRLPPVRGAPGVVSIHDLATLRFPEHVTPRFFEWFRRATEDAARRADVIVADSTATGDDVTALLDVPAARVRMIPLAVSSAYRDDGHAERDRRTAAGHGIHGPFVLFVGTTHPRKNVIRLLEAFARARNATGARHRLALVGDRGFGDAGVRAAVVRLGLSDAVTITGYVPEEDLPALYRAADVFTFPSLYEGFGLPVLEAMASGCPVLCSDVSSLPEVAGGAAELVDPSSVDSIEAGLVRLLGDADRRDECARAGRARAAEYSWSRTAAAHLELYRELASNGR